MRKKYQNTASQPQLKQLFEGFYDPDKNNYELEGSKAQQHAYSSIEPEPTPNKQLKFQKSSNRTETNSENIEKSRKIGSEMDRMEDWMTDMYTKRRNQRELKKNSNSSLDYSNVSVASSSSLKFPAIYSPPAYLASNDESKLVEQIRRVQNKIKELKFERNLASSQQEKYDSMRPFLELQNQNMMNMQYMMMMAQQNRPHEHHCCSRMQPSNDTKIVYIPFPQPNPFSPTNSQFIPYQPPNQQPSSFSPPQEKPVSQGARKTTKKTYNFKKIKKFRVAVIAVYFYLLFPKFVNRFTKKRHQLHSEKYFNTPEPHHTSIIAKAYDFLSDINFYELAKTVEEHRKEKQIRRVAKSKTAKLVISEQYGQAKNYEIYLGDLQVFLLVLLKKIHELIELGTLDSLIEEVSVGNLPYSFPIDRNYLEEEMYRLRFHPQKTYLQCDELQSKALLMVTFFVKLLTYDFLFVIREDLQWKGELLKKNNLKKNQMIEAEMVTTQMYISGILLHRYCMDILKDEISEIVGNVDKLDAKLTPLPMGLMAYEDKDEVNNDKPLRKSLEVAPKNVKNQGQREKESLDIEEYHLYEFQYIKKLTEFEGLMSEIIQKSGHNEEVKEKISDIIDQIFQRSIRNRDQQYKQITDSVLSEDKNMVSKKLGKEKNMLQMPSRSSEEKKEISELVRTIRQDKKKEKVGGQSDSGKHASKKLTMKNIEVVENKKAKKR